MGRHGRAGATMPATACPNCPKSSRAPHAGAGAGRRPHRRRRSAPRQPAHPVSAGIRRPAGRPARDGGDAAGQVPAGVAVVGRDAARAPRDVGRLPRRTPPGVRPGAARPRGVQPGLGGDGHLQRPAPLRPDGPGAAPGRWRRTRRCASSGPSRCRPTFGAAALARACHRKKVAIKVALLDQRVVAGLGNIYASEALHVAGVSPRRKAAALATRVRPADARPRRGSPPRSSRCSTRAIDQPASRFRVYERAGEPCPRRGCGGTIKRIVQAGRSTFYCPKCQR